MWERGRQERVQELAEPEEAPEERRPVVWALEILSQDLVVVAAEPEEAPEGRRLEERKLACRAAMEVL